MTYYTHVALLHFKCVLFFILRQWQSKFIESCLIFPFQQFSLHVPFCRHYTSWYLIKSLPEGTEPGVAWVESKVKSFIFTPIFKDSKSPFYFSNLLIKTSFIYKGYWIKCEPAMASKIDSAESFNMNMKKNNFERNLFKQESLSNCESSFNTTPENNLDCALI